MFELARGSRANSFLRSGYAGGGFVGVVAAAAGDFGWGAAVFCGAWL